MFTFGCLTDLDIKEKVGEVLRGQPSFEQVVLISSPLLIILRFFSSLF